MHSKRKIRKQYFVGAASQQDVAVVVVNALQGATSHARGDQVEYLGIGGRCVEECVGECYELVASAVESAVGQALQESEGCAVNGNAAETLVEGRAAGLV